MKSFLFVFLLAFSVNCSAQKTEPEFSIYFGNDFKDDSVTIIVNGVQVAHNIKLKATMIDPQNLIIIQDQRNFSVWPHNRKKQILKRIPIKDSMLNLDVEMNKIWRSFQFNLRQGRFFYPGYTLLRVGWAALKVFTIGQSKSGPIMF